MEPSVIEHIIANQTVRHLIAGWPRIEVTEKDKEAIARADGKFLALTTRERWAALSGVSVYDVTAWADFLFAHRIITENGVDAVALSVVARIGISGLPKDLRDQLSPKAP